MNEWIVPCNPKYYDIIGAFEKMNILDWKQSSKKIQPDDIVYIYVSKPVQAIIYKCKVNKVNLSHIEIDDSEFVIDGTNYVKYERHMELELIRIYDEKPVSIQKMRENDIKGNIQCTRQANQKLLNYIRTIEN